MFLIIIRTYFINYHIFFFHANWTTKTNITVTMVAYYNCIIFLILALITQHVYTLLTISIQFCTGFEFHLFLIHSFKLKIYYLAPILFGVPLCFVSIFYRLVIKYNYLFCLLIILFLDKIEPVIDILDKRRDIHICTIYTCRQNMQHLCND